ncbi:MAG: type II toxin-antitoxin system RelE/ParE family toxin [Synechococcaceae cyanobacterium SM2_3_1]|nr:type II toxin-antitoxin system RelE/ParE family toxin [Synechococcaceae cyanobacterium SM2_3_1]
MPSYVLTVYAEADLEDIIHYTLTNHGVAQTGKYVAALEQCAENLANGVGYYRTLLEVHPHLRVVRCQHHYIFGLMQSEEAMAVLAIYHENMDILHRLKARLALG